MQTTTELVFCPECKRLATVTRYVYGKGSDVVVERYFDRHLWDRTAKDISLCKNSNERVAEKRELAGVAA